MSTPPPVFTPGNPKPEKVQVISIVTLISGLINALYGLGITLLVVLGTLGIGLICAPITILPAVLGVFEIYSAVRLLGEPPHKPGNMQVVAILEIVAILTGNIFSVVAGIMNLVMMNEADVAAYLSNLPD